MWESHGEADNRIIVKPTPEKAQPVYTVSEPACVPVDQVVAAVTAPSVGLSDLEALLRRLFPTAPVPTEMEIMHTRECLCTPFLDVCRCVSGC